MVQKPITTKDNLQSDLQSILLSVEGKLNPQAAHKMQQAMDKLLEQDNKFNRAILENAVAELLTIGDSKELHKDEIKRILTFLESLKDFLAKDIKNWYEYRHILQEEQNKINKRIENIRLRFGR
jgi:hypothetical protein